MIVASRLADERLWAEVLNVGGYDLLVKPFEKDEVAWVVGLAFDQWSRLQSPAGRRNGGTPQRR